MNGSGSSLLLLSGLGADDRLFREQRKRFSGISVLPWIEPRRSENLTEYASRLTDEIARLRPAYVGGASFGGMVALEVGKVLRPEGVFLLGSCRCANSIRGVVRFGAAVARRLPEAILRRGETLAPQIAEFMGSNSREISDLFAQMYRSATPSFVRWGIGAIRDWSGVQDPGVPVHHIHGDSDRLLPLRRVRPDRVVSGAGHLLTLTHSHEVNDFLAEKMGLSR